MTIAQNWAKQRNFTKFRLRGVTASLNNIIKSPIVTSHECRNIQSAQNYLVKVIKEWEEHNSRSKENCLSKKGGE